MSRYRSTKGSPTPNSGELRGSPGEAQARHVLIMADEPGVCTQIARLLSQAGYVVDMAQDGSDALEKLKSRPYAALILDLEMPGNGEEVLYHQLKRVNKLLTRRVIFVAGDVANRGEREFVAATGNPMIEKPFDLNTLQQQLDSLLNDES